MPECDGAAVDVEPIRVDRQLLEAREHLGGEGFVELDEIDLIEREAGDLESLPDRGNRTSDPDVVDQWRV